MHRTTFSKADRILKRSEFLRVSRFGQRVHNTHFIATFYPGRFDRNRLGITVTKKVGNAVTRNRIKRLTREFFRRNRYRIKGCWDINLIAKSGITNQNTDQIFLSLEDIFDRMLRRTEH